MKGEGKVDGYGDDRRGSALKLRSTCGATCVGILLAGALCAAHALAHVLLLLPRKTCYNSVLPGRRVGALRAGGKRQGRLRLNGLKSSFRSSHQFSTRSENACLVFAALRRTPFISAMSSLDSQADWLFARISDSRRGCFADSRWFIW